RNSRLGLYAAAAELRGRRSRRQGYSGAWPARHHVAAPAAPARPRPAAAGAWRAVEPHAQHHRLRDLLTRALAHRDRASAGEPVRAVRACTDDAELPAVALFRDRRRVDDNGCTLSR